MVRLGDRMEIFGFRMILSSLRYVYIFFRFGIYSNALDIFGDIYTIGIRELDRLFVISLSISCIFMYMNDSNARYMSTSSYLTLSGCRTNISII